MENSNKYRILKEEYRNEYGVVQDSHYIVQELKSILFFWNGWFTIKHIECGYEDCTNTPTKFKTQADAELFIKEILCPNMKFAGWSSWVIEVCECTKPN